MTVLRSAPVRARGLADLAPGYRGLFCDVWGVIHNGEAAYGDAVDALRRFRRGGGHVVLITNAPRRRRYVAEQLAALGVPGDAYDDLVTSGDAARRKLAAAGAGRVFPLGTGDQLPLYEGLDVTLAGEEDCDLVCATALPGGHDDTPDAYEEKLRGWRDRGVRMLCANPDIRVEHGDRLVWCAGALAERYTAMGGRAEVVGKPHRPVYAVAHARLEAAAGGSVPRARILAVGDGVHTDLAGAAGYGVDALFVTAGVHAGAFGDRSAPDADAVRAFLAGAGVGAAAFMPHLVW